MENTIENKKKLFALYWGQEVFNNGMMGDELPYSFTSKNHGEIDDTDFLILTPLSQITDEDAIEVGKIFDYWPLRKNITESELDDFKNHLFNQAFEWDHYSIKESLNVVDFLRHNGYAFEWMGLSVEQLVSFGWVKLR